MTEGKLNSRNEFAQAFGLVSLGLSSLQTLTANGYLQLLKDIEMPEIEQYNGLASVV